MSFKILKILKSIDFLNYVSFVSNSIDSKVCITFIDRWKSLSFEKRGTTLSWSD